MTHLIRLIGVGATALAVAVAGCTNAGETPRQPTQRPSTTVTKPADGELAVTERAFTVLRSTEEAGYEVSYAAILRNTSTRDATSTGVITVAWLDANGVELRMGATSDDFPARESAIVPRLRPGQQSAVAGTFFVAGAPAQMTVTVTDVQWRPAAEVPAGTVTAANATLARGVDGPANSAVTVTVASEYTDEVDALSPVLFRDAAGALLGGSGQPEHTTPTDIPPGTTVRTIDVDTDSIPATTANVQVMFAVSSPS